MSSGILTILAMIAFGLITWWAYGKRRKKEFDRISRLPLEEDTNDAGNPS